MKPVKIMNIVIFITASCAADCKTCTDATVATCSACMDGYSDKDGDNTNGEDCYSKKHIQELFVSWLI